MDNTENFPKPIWALKERPVEYLKDGKTKGATVVDVRWSDESGKAIEKAKSKYIQLKVKPDDGGECFWFAPIPVNQES